MTERFTHLIGSALFKASQVPDDEGVKVPIKMKYEDKVYRSGTVTKVHEGVLRQALKDVAGIEIRDL